MNKTQAHNDRLYLRFFIEAHCGGFALMTFLIK